MGRAPTSLTRTTTRCRSTRSRRMGPCRPRPRPPSRPGAFRPPSPWAPGDRPLRHRPIRQRGVAVHDRRGWELVAQDSGTVQTARQPSGIALSLDGKSATSPVNSITWCRIHGRRERDAVAEDPGRGFDPRPVADRLERRREKRLCYQWLEQFGVPIHGRSGRTLTAMAPSVVATGPNQRASPWPPR